MRNPLRWIVTTACLVGFGAAIAQLPNEPRPDQRRDVAAAKDKKKRPDPPDEPGVKVEYVKDTAAPRSTSVIPPDTSVPDEPPPTPKNKP